MDLGIKGNHLDPAGRVGIPTTLLPSVQRHQLKLMGGESTRNSRPPNRAQQEEWHVCGTEKQLLGNGKAVRESPKSFKKKKKRNLLRETCFLPLLPNILCFRAQILFSSHIDKTGWLSHFNTSVKAFQLFFRLTSLYLCSYLPYVNLSNHQSF